MALFIQQFLPSSPTEWHIGEPLPEIKSRVVTFQADGDELDYILEALKHTSVVRLVAKDSDLFPALVYEYNKDGLYNRPLKMDDLKSLNTWMKNNLKKILQEKRELRITTVGDLLCFHAKNGEILYDGKNHYNPRSGYGRQS